MAFKCSNCGKPSESYQFGPWCDYFPNGIDGPHWTTGTAYANEIQVTQEQMDLLSNPNNSSRCCDMPIVKDR